MIFLNFNRAHNLLITKVEIFTLSLQEQVKIGGASNVLRFMESQHFLYS